MRFPAIFATAALAAALFLSCHPEASAQTARPSSADIQTLHDYTLTDGFLKKWEASMVDPSAPTCSLMTLNLRGNSLDEKIAEYDARPGNHSYLASHGLTARDMVLGTATMFVAAMQELRSKHPDMVEGGSEMQVNKQNIAFYQSHKDEMHELMQKAGRDRLRRDGGKLPDCAK